MGSPPKHLYKQLEALEPLFVGEIVQGLVIASPRPASKHVYAETSLSGHLVPRFMHGSNGPGGWWVLVEPELHLGPDVLVPDLAAWRKERMPELKDEAFFELAPDWICEILSPSTRVLDRQQKMPLYAGYGVAHAWLVDPEKKSVETFHRESGAWRPGAVLNGPLPDARIEPFAEVTMDLGQLWLP